MKKKFLVLPLALLFVTSCNNSPINIPKSPFNDTYNRIGMRSEYNYSLESITANDYNNIKNALYDATTIAEKEADVTSYSYQEEYRDLEYAYFGKESSSVSRCRMTSKHDNEQKYSNRIKIGTTTSNEQIQTVNGGIYKTNSTSSDYTFDLKYKEYPSYDTNYKKVTETRTSEGTTVVEGDPIPYVTGEEEKVFYLTPLTSHIKSHFGSEFKLLGDNCVYGKFNNGTNYLIKEGFSKFDLHMTKSGRKYVSSRNYFYEGILDSNHRITDFRYYTEQLILSEAWDGESIPILYLDKPELINFSETKYKINYSGTLEPYTKDVPHK